MITVKRPGKHEYYLGIAKAVSARSTCHRRQYGCVIVRNKAIIATGYNGSPRGMDNCSCFPKENCLRIKNAIPRGERYELCNGVHAEMNALQEAGRKNCIGGILYLYGFDIEANAPVKDIYPCSICLKMILNAEISILICGWKKYYRTIGKSLIKGRQSLSQEFILEGEVN